VQCQSIGVQEDEVSPEVLMQTYMEEAKDQHVAKKRGRKRKHGRKKKTVYKS